MGGCFLYKIFRGNNIPYKNIHLCELLVEGASKRTDSIVLVQRVRLKRPHAMWGQKGGGVVVTHNGSRVSYTTRTVR